MGVEHAGRLATVELRAQQRQHKQIFPLPAWWRSACSRGPTSGVRKTPLALRFRSPIGAGSAAGPGEPRFPRYPPPCRAPASRPGLHSRATHLAAAHLAAACRPPRPGFRGPGRSGAPGSFFRRAPAVVSQCGSSEVCGKGSRSGRRGPAPDAWGLGIRRPARSGAVRCGGLGIPQAVRSGRSGVLGSHSGDSVRSGEARSFELGIPGSLSGRGSPVLCPGFRGRCLSRRGPVHGEVRCAGLGTPAFCPGTDPAR